MTTLDEIYRQRIDQVLQPVAEAVQTARGQTPRIDPCRLRRDTLRYLRLCIAREWSNWETYPVGEAQRFSPEHLIVIVDLLTGKVATNPPELTPLLQAAVEELTDDLSQ
jgi:hypothetical protein